MDIPLPSAESIGKFIGGIIVSIVGGWALLKKLGFLDREDKVVEEPLKLRRAEDSSVKIATEFLEGKIINLEAKFDKKLTDERDFLLGQVNSCEGRITEQVQEVGRRIDTHYQGVNERLDVLIRGMK